MPTLEAQLSETLRDLRLSRETNAELARRNAELEAEVARLLGTAPGGETYTFTPHPGQCTCFAVTLRAFGCQCEAVGRMSATDPYVEHPGKVPPGGAA